ncbi:hypothetical protein Y032_0010g878 [Ancylostoma ceylanicum]|uniref:Uncharacterized protein n=1 Tax=Ancylostoma ceylanicum TaxID=53326 RepID=A0A016VH77_9BILA|nr:hypothetical protein Y032_0010g878 [Ancylostoma ceylanicum]
MVSFFDGILFRSFAKPFYSDFTGRIQILDLPPNKPMPPDQFAAAAMLAARTHERMTKQSKLIPKCVSKRSLVYRITTHGKHGWFARSKFQESHPGQ